MHVVPMPYTRSRYKKRLTELLNAALTEFKNGTDSDARTDNEVRKVRSFLDDQLFPTSFKKYDVLQEVHETFKEDDEFLVMIDLFLPEHHYLL